MDLVWVYCTFAGLVILVALLFILALCKSAAKGDQDMAKAIAKKKQEEASGE